MPWARRNLRGTIVFVRTRVDGSLEVGTDGRVDVRYKDEDGAKVYRASERNLAVAAGSEGSPAVSLPVPAPRATSVRPAMAQGMVAPVAAATPGEPPIVIYTDGACSGNPGPMGVGVVVMRGKARQEIGEYLGIGTNNIAELTAIERALDALGPAERSRRVLVHADSAYAIGVVSGAMKAKKNVDLVARIRAKVRQFPHLQFVKVRGHAGVPENERCDQLATGAVAARR